MATIQDRYIGVNKLENALQFVNSNETTKITASEIAQFIDEYYSEFFDFIASDKIAYNVFNYRLELMHYYSY